MARTPEGEKTNIPGMNWSKVKKATRKAKGGRVVVESDKISALNLAIYKLITIKKRRMNDHESPQRINSVQTEIDKLMKMKRNLINTERYLEWGKKHAKQR